MTIKVETAEETRASLPVEVVRTKQNPLFDLMLIVGIMTLIGWVVLSLLGVSHAGTWAGGWGALCLLFLVFNYSAHGGR
jgi:hypothetical protein